MIEKEVLAAFNLSLTNHVLVLNTGLINNSFVVTNSLGEKYLIQQLNDAIFLNPGDIQINYQLIQKHLIEKDSFALPKIISTENGDLIYKFQGQYWRCMEFIPSSYSPLVAETAQGAYTVAKCFGKYSADLMDLDINQIKVILPGFHNLNLRFQQFQEALKNASEERKGLVSEEIKCVYFHEEYVTLFNKIVQNKELFPTHILHQDCKIANILFSEITNEVICPIDLDTTQPGLFFSDLGDMIRSMVPNISENESDIEKMEIREDFLSAIKDGYLDEMGKALTKSELELLDKSGPIIIYMQALRFLTDFLNNDVYYRTTYPLQNKDRARNQFHLLSLINKVLKSKVSSPLFSI
jgi:hypothetical protein